MLLLTWTLSVMPTPLGVPMLPESELHRYAGDTDQCWSGTGHFVATHQALMTHLTSSKCPGDGPWYRHATSMCGAVGYSILNIFQNKLRLGSRQDLTCCALDCDPETRLGCPHLPPWHCSPGHFASPARCSCRPFRQSLTGWLSADAWVQSHCAAC